MDVKYHKYSHCVHSNVTKLQAWLYAWLRAWVHVHGYGYVHGYVHGHGYGHGCMRMHMATATATGMHAHGLSYNQQQVIMGLAHLYYIDFFILIHQYIMKTIQL